MKNILLTVLALGLLVAGLESNWIWTTAAQVQPPIHHTGPEQVSQLPADGRLGDMVFLNNTNVGNPIGVYACNQSTCSPPGGWTCVSCGGGGFTAGTDLTGTPTSQTVVGLQGRSITASAPSNNCFLYWDPANQYRCRILLSADIPNHSAALLTSGTLDEARIPATINGDKLFTGNITGNSVASNGAGEAFLELKDNTLCTTPATGFVHLCSQSGVIGIFAFGGSFTSLELVSRKGAANGYAGLDAGALVPSAQLGTGSATAGNVLHGDRTWGPVGSSTFSTVTFSATPTFDLSVTAIFKITLTGNVTSSTLANIPAGPGTITLAMIICQDATGGRTFVFPATMKGTMTVGPAASTCSTQAYVTDGTNAWAIGPGATNQ